MHTGGIFNLPLKIGLGSSIITIFVPNFRSKVVYSSNLLQVMASTVVKAVIGSKVKSLTEDVEGRFLYHECL